MDSAELLQRWQAGDAAAGARLFELHCPSVVRFLRNKVSDAARDDLVQEVFMAASKAPFAGRSSVRSWLIGIAWRQLQNHLRAAARRARREARFGMDSVVELGQDPEQYMLAQQEARLLLEALRRVPLQYQVVLELHYWEGMTGADIGRALDLPLGTVKTRVRDGRARLETVMRRIAISQEVLESTLDNLGAWARRIKDAWGHPQVS
jgi:RNA polymerase sigma-70 factor (ECF subfamily)